MAMDENPGISRSVAENSRAGTAVGDPVAATDQGDSGPDTLTYSLSGLDAASFDIDSGTGQIRVKAGNIPDFEAKQPPTPCHRHSRGPVRHRKHPVQ